MASNTTLRVPAVSGESWDEEAQTMVEGMIHLGEQVGDGPWGGPNSSESQQEVGDYRNNDSGDRGSRVIKSENNYSRLKHDSQQRVRTKSYSEGRSRETGRDGWNNESTDVKYMGKANIKRDPYNKNNTGKQQNRPYRYQDDRVSGGEDDWKEHDSVEERPRESGGRNFGNRPSNNNNHQMGRNRRGGGLSRNWNHNSSSNDRPPQSSAKENRFNSRVVNTETRKDEENWDEGLAIQASPPRIEQQVDTIDTITMEYARSGSKGKSKVAESWNEPSPPVAAKIHSKLPQNDTENWDDAGALNTAKVESRSVVNTVSASWNGTEATSMSKVENNSSSNNWGQGDTSDGHRNKNSAGSRNRRVEDWNDTRVARNDGYSNPRSEKSEDRNGAGSRRGNFYSKNGRSEDWNETNVMHNSSKRDNHYGHQNGWRQGQGKKYSEDRVQEEKREDWEETNSNERTSVRNNNNSYQGYQRKRGSGSQGRSRNSSDNWNKDGNQANWNRREDNARPFGKENYSGNRTYYRTRNYSESRSRSEEHASDGSENSGSSKEPIQDKSPSYQHQNDTYQQNQPTSRFEKDPAYVGSSHGCNEKETMGGGEGGGNPTSTTGTRLSDKVLHYMAKIKEEGEIEEVKQPSHVVVDMHAVQQERYVTQQERYFTAAPSDTQYQQETSDFDGSATQNMYDELKSESEVACEPLEVKHQQQLIMEADPPQMYYEDDSVIINDDQNLTTMSDPLYGGEMPVDNQQALESIKEWPEEPPEEETGAEYDYTTADVYQEAQQLDICNGTNDQDLSKEVDEGNQVPMENHSLNEHMMSNVPHRYMPNNYYTLVPPPSQLNPALMMALPSAMNMPIQGTPYGFSIPPPNLMVPTGQMPQNMYQNRVSHMSQDTPMKPNMSQELIDQNMQQQQNSSLKQGQVMTSTANSNLIENNMHTHSNVSSSHLNQSPIYHPNMGQLYATYASLPHGAPVHSNPLQVFMANSQKHNINQSMPQGHHVTNANMSHNPALSQQPPNYNSNMTHPSFQNNTNCGVTNGQGMIDSQSLNSIKEGILKQVLSGNMTDPSQIAAAATLLLQPATAMPQSPLYMTATQQYYPSMNMSNIPNVNYTPSSMMSNGYCSGLLAVETNGSAAPSVNGSPSPHAAPTASLYGSNISVPNTGTCSQVTQSHDCNYHPSRPVVMPSVVPPPYVYHQMYPHHQLYQNGTTPEQLSLLQQQMASLSMNQQQHPQQPTQTLPPHLQQQLQQPPPGFNT